MRSFSPRTRLRAGLAAVAAVALGFTAGSQAMAAPEVETAPQVTAPEAAQANNPFAGATGYINPQWAEKVKQLGSQTGGALGEKISKVASFSSGVWMDRIGAITEEGGLRGHLNAALKQAQSGSQPVVVPLVIYNLPNRDCAALASNGELLVGKGGMKRYRTEYIDPIVKILSDPKYSELRIAAVIEPDSLPNLITNIDEPKCAEAKQSGAYEKGIQYALNKLNPLKNVWKYLDAAHSGWLGWEDNLGPSVELFAKTVKGTEGGLNSLDGFITNTANYTPLNEPNLPNPDKTVGGQPIESAKFYEYNPYFDEADFSTALREAAIQAGFPNSIGMLIDTGRNGWGGPKRPGEASGNTVDQYVNSGRVDRRLHRGNWCNQAGAGIGQRPTANPAPGIHAYVWIKPPGESDGISEPTDGPNDEGKRHDKMCDPAYSSDLGVKTGALDNAPHAGDWFPEQLKMLARNAFPPL